MKIAAEKNRNCEIIVSPVARSAPSTADEFKIPFTGNEAYERRPGKLLGTGEQLRKAVTVAGRSGKVPGKAIYHGGIFRKFPRGHGKVLGKPGAHWVFPGSPQLTFRESLRDIETCLRSMIGKLIIADERVMIRGQGVWAIQFGAADGGDFEAADGPRLSRRG